MKVAILVSLLLVGSFLVGFYVLSPIFPMEKAEPKQVPPPVTSSTPVKNWGWTDDYCMRKLKLKDTSIILIPRCEF